MSKPTVFLSLLPEPVSSYGIGDTVRLSVPLRVHGGRAEIRNKDAALILTPEEAATLALSLLGSISIALYETRPDLLARLNQLTRIINV